jgi:lipopolysaccharide transport system permease protein
VFTLFFGKFAGFENQTHGYPYTVFCYATLVPWIYFNSAVVMASNSLLSNANLINKIYFPRLLAPASAVVGGVVDYAIAFLVLVAMMAWYRIVPSPLAVVMVPLLTLLLIGLALGVGLWLAALNVHYRDIRFVVPVAMQIWMFGSPIIYSLSRISEKYPQYRWLVALNPVSGIMEGFRAYLLPEGNWDLAPLGVSVVLTAIILISGCYFFRRMEKTFADFV